MALGGLLILFDRRYRIRKKIGSKA
jgi:hypothetical protein